MKRWLGGLEREVALAIDAGELPADTGSGPRRTDR
jgi:hypothetical protein